MGNMRKVWQPEIFYHITMRGNNKQRIFISKGDFNFFTHTLQQANTIYSFTIIAYCFMNNHYHLLIRSPRVPLSEVLIFINQQYSNYFKRKYKFVDQLYETRYYTNMISDPKELLKASKYIHQNHLYTQRTILGKLENYPYSSYPFYVDEKKYKPSYINTYLLPSLIKKYPELKMENYNMYCENIEMEVEKSSHNQYSLT
ncbi:transposase [Psychrobacillus sp. INOP01]|uniref:transposase n=1 Tax=Psychrobacillus sp. INOP01 TaxID=2829187 RepID=UPI001BA9F02F|nr:transposase [Psychrobacillus sp. INOP01]QUG40748.1 transposase [Psychrobacillus sp. INOP01]